jgi:hypothetical protein
VEAGQSSRGQQLCEAALGLARLDRDAIDQKLVVRDAEQEAVVPTECLPQFRPAGLELGFGPLVLDSVEPRVLDENIEAVEECPRGRIATSIGLGRG